MRTLSLVVLLAACASGSGTPPGSAAPAAVPGSTAVPSASTDTRSATDAGAPEPAEADRAAPAVPLDAEPASADPVQAPVDVAIHAIGAAMAEDGLGGRARSQTAVAIDLQTEGWPGRAMEPALHVGELTFEHYSHTSPTSLRFVVRDASLVPLGAQAQVRYGDRVVASFTLPAPQAP